MTTLEIINGKLQMDSRGNLSSVSELKALRQKVERKLKHFRGEWFLDVTSGVPYLQTIFNRPISVGLAASILNSEILEEPEVTALGIVTTDVQQRDFRYTAQVVSIYGEFEVRV